VGSAKEESQADANTNKKLACNETNLMRCLSSVD
jgi:hypothetical protein